MSTEKKSGIATFTSVVPFSPSEKPESMFVRSVLSDGVRLPEDALVLFYGHTQTKKEISDIVREADERQLYTNSMSVTVDVGPLVPIMTPENLPETRLLNMVRLSTAMDQEIIRHWKIILNERGVTHGDAIKEKAYFKNRQYVLEDPQYLGDLLQFEAFSHVEAILFPYSNPKYPNQSLGSRAALFSYDHVLDVHSESFPEIKAELPALAPRRAASMKM